MSGFQGEDLKSDLTAGPDVEREHGLVPQGAGTAARTAVCQQVLERSTAVGYQLQADQADSTSVCMQGPLISRDSPLLPVYLSGMLKCDIYTCVKSVGQVKCFCIWITTALTHFFSF